MKVFLTGATGFVGSAVLSRLLSGNADVVALVRSETAVFPDGVERVVGDLAGLSEDPSLALSPSPQSSPVKGEEVLSGVDVVVHAAARAHIMRDEVADPLAEYRRVNVDATLNLARRAAISGVRRFVYLSSIKVNGERTYPPHPSPLPVGAREIFLADDAPAPEDAYGVSKLEAEQGLLALARETGIEVVIIRPPLVYGPGVKGNFASLVKWIKKGVPLPFGAVRNQRSLVTLDNLVDFIVLCADRERSPKAANEVFLISDGEDVSTSELLRKVAKAYGLKSRLLPVPVGLMRFAARLLGKGAMAERLLGSLQVDSSKARELLGWRPVTSMDEQLAKMAAYDEGMSLE